MKPGMTRYQCDTRWQEIVPAPKLLSRFWFFEMIWHLLVYRKCSLVTYHDADSEFGARLDAIGHVMAHMPGPQRFHRCRARVM